MCLCHLSEEKARIPAVDGPSLSLVLITCHFLQVSHTALQLNFPPEDTRDL